MIKIFRKDRELGAQKFAYDQQTGIYVVDVNRHIKPYRKVKESDELRKLWQLQNLATMRRFDFSVPKGSGLKFL